MLSVAAFAVGSGTQAADARAAPSAQLVVHAVASCATRADVAARVRARAPRIDFVEKNGAIAVEAHFSAMPAGGVAGDVVFTSAGGPPSKRRLLARSCNEAADAVALIIAVTLDPASAARGELGGETGASHANPGPEQRSGAGAASAGERATQPPVTATEMRTGGALPELAPLSFGVQLAAQAIVGPAPAIMPGAAVYAMAELQLAGVWRPALLLGASHAERRAIPERAGKASFGLDAASIDVCPLRARLGVVEARPCGSVLLGRFTARATETLNPAEESARPLWIVGGSAVATAELFWRLELAARVAIGANLVRDSFSFAPSVFHTVPALSGAASLGVGLRWR